MKTKIMLTALLLSISAQATAQTFVFRAVSGAPIGESSLVGGKVGTPSEPPQEPPQDEYGCSWWAFAQEHSLPHGAWDQGIAWSNRSLSNVPSAPYPTYYILTTLDLSNNNISTINSLNQIDYVQNNLLLNNNRLTQVDLSGLSFVYGSINLSNNDLTQIVFPVLEGVMGTLDLSNNNLTQALFNYELYVGTLDLRNNPDISITGLASIYIDSRVYIDANYNGDKLDFFTNFCQSMDVGKLIGPEITQVCEFPM